MVNSCSVFYGWLDLLVWTQTHLKTWLHLWGLWGVVSSAWRVQLWFPGLIGPLKTDFLEAKSVLPRSGRSCYLSLRLSVPSVQLSFLYHWELGVPVLTQAGMGIWLSVNIMEMEMMGSTAKTKELTNPIPISYIEYRLSSSCLLFDKLGIHVSKVYIKTQAREALDVTWSSLEYYKGGKSNVLLFISQLCGVGWGGESIWDHLNLI